MKFFKLFLAGLLIHGIGSCSVAVAGPSDTRIRADYVDGQDSSRNYIKDGDAETGTAVKGWTCYADAAGTSPVDGTGGTPNVTFTKTTSSPLENNNSFVFAKDSANRQGQGCSYDFTIDSRLKSKMLQITFDNIVGSGTFAAGSDTTNSDVMVYLYDITNSKLVPLQGQTKFYSNSTTLAEPFRAWYQAAPDSVNYRLILHVVSTSTSAFTLKSDVFKISESKLVTGTIITDIQTYTPTISHNSGGITNATATGRWMRVGPKLIGQASILFSNTSAPFSGLGVSLPPGIVGDISKSTAATSVFPTGVVYIRDAGVSNTSGTSRYVSTSNTIQAQYHFVKTDDAGSAVDPAQITDVTNTTPITFGASDEIIINFELPIAGWSAGARMSDGYDGRVVGYQAYITSGTQTITAGSTTAVIFNAERSDEDSSYDTSTGLLTAKRSGRLYVSYGLRCVTGGTAPSSIAAVIYKNGISGTGYSVALMSDLVANKEYTLSGSAYIDVIAGDTIGIYSVPMGQNITHAPTAGNYIAAHWVTGTPFMSPTAIYLWRYSTAAGQSIPGSAAMSIVDFGTKVIATGGNVTTGSSWKFTPDQPGFYRIRGAIAYGANTFVSGNFANLLLYKTGSLYSQLDYKRFDATSGGGFAIGGMDVVELTTSDYIDLRTQHTNASSQPLAAADNQNYIIIERIK